MRKKAMLCRGVLSAVLWVLSCAAVNATPILLSNVPDYEWQDGCTPTSATMLVSYFALNGYQNLHYSNLVPGGTPPLTTFTKSSTIVTNAINTMAADIGTDSSGISWCRYWLNGRPFTAQDSLNGGYNGDETAYGLWEYAHNAGYNVPMNDVFNQPLYSSSATYGVTFANFESDINAGLPVLVWISNSTEGHTMLAYGYNAVNNTVYVRDTWQQGGEYNGGTMTWGGQYDGMTMTTITEFIPAGGTPPVPEPCTMLLFGFGLAGLIGFKKGYLR